MKFSPVINSEIKIFQVSRQKKQKSISMMVFSPLYIADNSGVSPSVIARREQSNYPWPWYFCRLQTNRGAKHMSTMSTNPLTNQESALHLSRCQLG